MSDPAVDRTAVQYSSGQPFCFLGQLSEQDRGWGGGGVDTTGTGIQEATITGTGTSTKQLLIYPQSALLENSSHFNTFLDNKELEGEIDFIGPMSEPKSLILNILLNFLTL